MKDRFYLVSLRDTVGSNTAFHSHHGRGYSTDQRNARVYTREEAQRAWNTGREFDLPVDADAVDRHLVFHVDHQFVPGKTILSESATKYVGFVNGQWDGNDLFWLADAGKGQTIYARGNGLEVGQQYAVYREGDPYTMLNAKGKKYDAGLELNQVATGVAVASENDITTIELTDSFNAEVRRGDRVLPVYDPMLPTLFYPTMAEDVAAGGQIVRVMGSIGTAAKNSVVTIDRGNLEGVQVGHVFSINQKGEQVRDPKTKEMVQLPGQKIGNLMVFKTFDHFSYAYVLDSSLPIKIGAYIQPPLMDD